MHLDDDVLGCTPLLVPFLKNRFLRRAQWAFVASTIEGFIDFDRVR
jgi:hypothetical protein